MSKLAFLVRHGRAGLHAAAHGARSGLRAMFAARITPSYSPWQPLPGAYGLLVDIHRNR